MFSKLRPTATTTATDQRVAKREPMLGVTVMVRSANGIVREGVVQDVSDGGIRISGDATGFNSGDKTEIVLVIQGERVGYSGEIRHLDAPNRFYGVHFESGPIRGAQRRESVKQCKQCKKDYPDEHRFCFRCGQRLIGGHRATSPADRQIQNEAGLAAP